MFDAERTVAGDLAKLVRRYSGLSRTFEKVGKSTWLDGDDGAGALFAEESIFVRSKIVVEIDGGAKSGRGVPCPYGGRCGGEAGFGEGDREAAVADVVRGLHEAFGGRCN